MDHLTFLDGGEESATGTNGLRLLAENSLAQLLSLLTQLNLTLLDDKDLVAVADFKPGYRLAWL
jgi:hypothetical protein